MDRLDHRLRNRGLTLSELCLCIALLAVLAGLAIPGFRGSWRAAAVRSATFELLGGLQQARASSILESRTGVFCLADAVGACLGPGTAAQAWRTYLESGTPAEPQVGHRLPAGIEVRANRNPLRFWPHSLSASTGTLTICDLQRLAPPRAIVISQGGRARLTRAEPGACA